MPRPSTMYERAGGEAFFEALSQRFYTAVRSDPVLLAVYPDGDGALEEARVRLRDFLIQFWGGPEVYRQRRGEPRLRMRHAPFVIGPTERDAWVRHMLDAVRAGGLGPMDELQMTGYFSAAATSLINTGAGPVEGSGPNGPGPAAEG